MGSFATIRRKIAEYETKIESLKTALAILEGEAKAKAQRRIGKTIGRARKIEATRTASSNRLLPDPGSITRQVFDVVAKGQPMQAGEIASLSGQKASVISRLVKQGLVTRTGKFRHYTYRLSPQAAKALEAEG